MAPWFTASCETSIDAALISEAVNLSPDLSVRLYRDCQILFLIISIDASFPSQGLRSGSQIRLRSASVNSREYVPFILRSVFGTKCLYRFVWYQMDMRPVSENEKPQIVGSNPTRPAT